MKIKIPNIEIAGSREVNVGILTDFPATIRFSPAIKELLDLSEGGALDIDRAISTLEGRFNIGELHDAIDELKEFLGGINKKDEIRWKPLFVSALYVDLPENDLSATALVKKAVGFFEPQFGRAVHLTLNLRNPAILSSMNRLCEELIGSRKHSYRFLFQVPIELVDRQLADFIVSNNYEVKLLFRYGDDPRGALGRIPDAVRRLTSNRVVSVRIEDVGMQKNLVMETINILRRVGIRLIQFGYGECNLFNEILNDGHCIGLGLSITEILSHAETLNSSIPKTFTCGAGRWYWAVSKEGEIFPCHRLIRSSRHLAGTIEKSDHDKPIQNQFAKAAVYDRKECTTCWAISICGGGCILQWEDDLHRPASIPETRCDNIRGNIKAAALLSADRDAAIRSLMQKNIDFLKRHSPQFQYEGDTLSKDAVVLSTVGKSMFPLFISSTELKIEFLHPNQLKTGDIFSYIRNNRIITHRLIIRIKLLGNSFIYEKGDNGFFQEVMPSEIIGRITHFKNHSMVNFIPTKSLPVKSAAKIIALYTILAWGLSFLIKYGFSFVRQLARHHFSFSDAVKNFAMAQKFELNSQHFLIVLNFPVRVINYLLLLTLKLKEVLWMS